MLTISKPLTAAQAQKYHQKEFTAREQRYWSQEENENRRVQGEWQGKLAVQYGLVGAVEKEDFARLAQGQHPKTGEQLVRHRAHSEYQNADGKKVTSIEHRAGWDATFSAPKSVSLTALVGGDERVREAHCESVRLALAELERYTQARMGGNHLPETTGKFIAAKFEHDTARPVNGYAAPQLHTHVVIFNITERHNKETRALQERSLFRSQQFATAVYQSELTYRLTRLGYELETGRSGAPEIKGYTQEYLDASSPRSQQIREHLAKLDLSSKEAAEIAAHFTRDQKELLSSSEVLAAHRQLAAAFGNQAEQVVAAARARMHQMKLHQESVPPSCARESLTFARDKNFEREAVVDERVLMRDAMRRSMGQARYADLRRNFDKRLAEGEFVAVEARNPDPSRLITTRETIAAEQAIVDCMRTGQGQVSPVLSWAQAIAHAETESHLNSAQRRVVEDVLSSRDRIHGLQGVAGAGKTTVLESIRSVAEDRGFEVLGFAPTSRATKQLEAAGIPAETLQRFLVETRDAIDESSKKFYFLDESSLASTKQVLEFLRRLRPQDRMLLIGDIRQHQAVEAGRPFQQLQDAGMRTAHLDTIVRQKDPELKNAVEHLACGDINTGIEALRSQGRITEIRNRAERLEAIARKYANSAERTLIVSPDNASRRDLNDAVRQELRAKKALPSEERSFSVLVPRQDMTGAERQWAARYHVGNVLRYSRGSQALGIQAGAYVRVVRIDAGENRITVISTCENEITYDPKRLSGVSVYSEIGRRFSIGDRIQFTAPDRELGVANRDLGTIQSISPDGNIDVRLDSRRELTFRPAANPHFDHGYAVTSHSSQGLTTERVLINVDSEMHPDLINMRFAYVSVSRASLDAQIYTDNAELLAKTLGHDVSKSSAMDFSQELEWSVSPLSPSHIGLQQE